MKMDKKLVLFGNEVLTALKERIGSEEMSEEDEDLAQLAVRCGVLDQVEYDPKIHIDFDGTEGEYEKGDTIYYWGRYAKVKHVSGI